MTTAVVSVVVVAGVVVAVADVVVADDVSCDTTGVSGELVGVGGGRRRRPGSELIRVADWFGSVADWL